MIAILRNVQTLLMPRIWSFKNPILLKKKKGHPFRGALMGGVGLLIWSGIFIVSYRVLIYFKSIQDMGDLLAFKLLSMMLITIFSLLVFSGIITCLAKLYLSKDLHLVHSFPVPSYAVFFARWLESTVDSSWMVIVYTLPVFISYGIAYHAGLTFYAMILLNLFYSLAGRIRHQRFSGDAGRYSHSCEPASQHFCIFRPRPLFDTLYRISPAAARTSGRSRSFRNSADVFKGLKKPFVSISSEHMGI